MAQSFYPTASTMVNQALTDIGAIDPEGGIGPTTSQTTSALQIFNFLVTSWIGLGMQVWCQKTATYTLSNGVGNFTVGPAGTLAIARPMSITQAWLRDTTVTYPIDIPVRVGGREEYYSLSQKTTPGTPNFLYYDRGYDRDAGNSGATANGTIYLWPVPDTSVATQYDLGFTYTRPIQDFNASSDTLDFPQEWYNALRWNLANELCPGYSVPVMKWDRIRGMARDTLDLAMSTDRQDTSVTIAPDYRGIDLDA